jgi:hypothetical protein
VRDAGRMRFMALAVVVVAGALVVASRMTGRLTVTGGSGAAVETDRSAPAPGLAGAGSGVVPDLSFYRQLGSEGGRQGGAPGGQGDRLPAVPDEAGVPDGAFVVQVLATRDRDQARRLKRRLAARGLPATVVEGQMDGESIYRVRVGRYRERRTAVRLSERLRVEEGLTTWILQEVRSR